ncbi:hypothetical protein I2D83_00150 [Pectobacterium aroidearum]|nr:hypothetical protein [Pectobacterium aroidearum]QPI45373.1 hypothetical protein I2D83_00150 [Pectobacterium aroidearum]
MPANTASTIEPDTNIKVYRRDAKRLCHIWQSRGNHRSIKKLHKKSAGNQQRQP